MKRPVGHMTRDDVVSRARSALGRHTVYGLGAGGRDPNARTPGDPCDCSGFAAWCLGIDRYLPNDCIPLYPDGGGWFETSALVRDARGPFGFVAEVDPDMALPGDIIVYGDKNGRQGHVGIVTDEEPDHGYPKRVAHCSSSNYRIYGDAIMETDSLVFRANSALVARVAWVG